MTIPNKDSGNAATNLGTYVYKEPCEKGGASLENSLSCTSSDESSFVQKLDSLYKQGPSNIA